MHHDGGRRLRHLAREEPPDRVPQGEAGGAQPLGGGVLVTGVDQLLEDDKALAKQGEERVMREEAKGRHVLVAKPLLAKQTGVKGIETQNGCECIYVFSPAGPRGWRLRPAAL